MNRLEEIRRIDRAIARQLAGQRNNFTDPRRHQNAFPETIFAGSKRAARFRMNLAYVDVLGGKALGNSAVMLFEQCNEQMFDTDVIVVVVPALLFGGAKNASGGWAEFREQLAAAECPSCELNEPKGNGRGDTI